MNEYLIPGLEKSPSVFERLIHHIPHDKLDYAIVEGRFTPREVIAHMADWEPIFLDRIQRAVAQPGVMVEAFDEGEMAVRHRYDLSEIDEQLELFKKRRIDSLAFIRTLTEDQKAIDFRHPERGPMRVWEQVNLELGHDVYHIEQLSAYLG